MDHRYIKEKTRGFNLQIGRFLFAKNKKGTLMFNITDALQKIVDHAAL